MAGYIAVFIVLFVIVILQWHLTKKLSRSLLIPQCTSCKAVDTLGRADGQFCCTHCGALMKMADVAKYEEDVQILLENPEIYENFKEARNSMINMGFGKAQD